MSNRQKAHIVTRSSGLQDLNDSLQKGWRVAHLTPMGGGADALAALVVLERREDASTKIVKYAEEETEEVLSEVVLGQTQETELSEERNGGPPEK